MKQICLFILLIFLFSCKSPKQKEEKILQQKETTTVESEETLTEKVEEFKQEPKEEQQEDTETYLERQEWLRKEKAKRDSFLVQFNSNNIYNDTLVSVIGIIQNSGIRESFKIDIKPEFQLTNPIKNIFLVTDKDISDYWGKCVRVTGQYLNDWNFKSNYFGRTAISLESIETVSSDYCLNSPNFTSVLEKKYRSHANDTILECFIHRTKRPSPDIGYDYGIELTEPIKIPSELWTGFKNIPVNININLDTLNYLIEEKKKVKLFGNLTGGYAEMIVFSCKKYKGQVN